MTWTRTMSILRVQKQHRDLYSPNLGILKAELQLQIIQNIKQNLLTLEMIMLKEDLLSHLHQANKVRKNMNSIENNINQLHLNSQVNWSKLDLKQKYLSNGSNFNSTYNRETHTLFDYLKVKDVNNFNSKPHYEKIISGNPFEHVSKDHKFQSDSLAKLCPGSFGSKSSADFGVKVMNVNNDSSKNLNKITSMLNVDQKLIYARKIKSKYIRTDTISPEGGQK